MPGFRGGDRSSDGNRTKTMRGDGRSAQIPAIPDGEWVKSIQNRGSTFGSSSSFGSLALNI